jgi:hypothetical protein
VAKHRALALLRGDEAFMRTLRELANGGADDHDK